MFFFLDIYLNLFERWNCIWFNSVSQAVSSIIPFTSFYLKIYSNYPDICILFGLLNLQSDLLCRYFYLIYRLFNQMFDKSNSYLMNWMIYYRIDETETERDNFLSSNLIRILVKWNGNVWDTILASCSPLDYKTVDVASDIYLMQRNIFLRNVSKTNWLFNLSNDSH